MSVSSRTGRKALAGSALDGLNVVTAEGIPARLREKFDAFIAETHTEHWLSMRW